jgi:hypothetical protein
MLKSNPRSKILHGFRNVPFFSQMRFQVKARFCQGRRECDVHFSLDWFLAWLDLSWRLGKERNNLISFPMLNNTSSITLLSAVNLLDCRNSTFHFEEKGDVIFA